MPRCPLCESSDFRRRLEASEIEREIRLRDRFVRRRFPYSPSAPELMDLTEFLHGAAGELADCVRCGLTLRLEAGTAAYQDDVYDPHWLALLYPRYRQAFRGKERQYHGLLRHNAEVLELGSHLGAFLETAEEWGWRPQGLDVGRDTSRFARRRGLSVLREEIGNARLRAHRRDALFVWNCFEQMEDPVAVLTASHGALRRHGLLVVRTPNIAFYQRARKRWMSGGTASAALRSLAYNNLLGFPYRTGYRPGTLSTLLRRNGFQPIAGFDSTVLTMPYTELTSRLRREIRKTHEPFSQPLAKPPLALRGPWIEIVCRKMD